MNNFREHPLVLYVFSTQSNIQKLFTEQTRSGSLCINETIMFYGGKNALMTNCEGYLQKQDNLYELVVS